MYEIIWKIFGAFIFIYSGIINLCLLIVFILRKLCISRMPWSIIRRKYRKHIIKMMLSSIIGLSVGFTVYTSADTMARVYSSWIHYVVIIVLSYLAYKYRLLPLTNNQA